MTNCLLKIFSKLIFGGGHHCIESLLPEKIFLQLLFLRFNQTPNHKKHQLSLGVSQRLKNTDQIFKLICALTPSEVKTLLLKCLRVRNYRMQGNKVKLKIVKNLSTQNLFVKLNRLNTND